MRDKDDRQTRVRLHLTQHIQDLFAHRPIQGGNSLIANKHPGFEYQCARDGYALRLPARQLMRKTSQELLAQPDLVEAGCDPLGPC